MGVTAIKEVVNNSQHTVHLHNTENERKFMNGGDIAPFSTQAVDMWIP